MVKFEKGDKVTHVQKGKSGYPASSGTVEHPTWGGTKNVVGVQWADGTFSSEPWTNLTLVESIKEAWADQVKCPKCGQPYPEHDTDKPFCPKCMKGLGEGKNDPHIQCKSCKTYYDQSHGRPYCPNCKQDFIDQSKKKKHESVSRIIRKELTSILGEAMRDRNAQCMSCGSYFLSESHAPQNCPKCLSEDVDTLDLDAAEPLEEYSGYIKSQEEAERIAKALDKLGHKPARGAAKALRSNWKQISYNTAAQEAILDMLKNSREFKTWKGRNLKGEAAGKGSKSFKVECQECGKRFTTASMSPRCPKCRSVDIDLEYGFANKSVKKEADYLDVKPGQFLGIKNPKIDPKNGTKVGFKPAGNMMRDERTAIRWAKRVADAEGVDTKVLVATGAGGNDVFYVWKKKK